MIERDAGAALEQYAYRGHNYVAGRPGSRCAIRISNRTGGRVLALMAVDGVNMVTAQTADRNQSGYVLSPWQTYEIAGWRKIDQAVTAFEFTSLPDSYAARTGRPNDVGVIGVAVRAERVYCLRRPCRQPLPTGLMRGVLRPNPTAQAPMRHRPNASAPATARTRPRAQPAPASCARAAGPWKW